MIIVGGVTDTGLTSSSENFYTNEDCDPQDLPHGGIEKNSLLFSSSNHTILSCGGNSDEYSKLCLELNPLNSRWYILNIHSYVIST